MVGGFDKINVLVKSPEGLKEKATEELTELL